jgi:hypothetical protein
MLVLPQLIVVDKKRYVLAAYFTRYLRQARHPSNQNVTPVAAQTAG